MTAATTGGAPEKAGGFLHRITAPVSSAILFALVSVVSFTIAFSITGYVPQDTDTRMIGALWAMISAIVVMQDTRSATISTAWLRILGSLIGAVFSALYLVFFPFSIVGMGILIGVVVLTCELLHLPGHLRLAGLTAGIVMVISVVNPDIPPFVNAATRFFEVMIGSSVAVVAAWIWQYVFGSE
jgi:Predicted membrane protein